jgi:hypothetical protein
MENFEVFMAMKIQAQDFWVVTQCSVVVGYHLHCGDSKVL